MRCREPDHPILAVVLLLSMMGIALGVVMLISDGKWPSAISVLMLLACVMLFFRYKPPAGVLAS
jgi:hypothetical protein